MVSHFYIIEYKGTKTSKISNYPPILTFINTKITISNWSISRYARKNLNKSVTNPGKSFSS